MDGRGRAARQLGQHGSTVLLGALVAIAAGCGGSSHDKAADTVTVVKSTPTTTTSAGTIATAPTRAKTKPCASADGWRVRVGEVTSCPFAYAALDQVLAQPTYDQVGATYPVRAQSPVTKQSYPLKCNAGVVAQSYTKVTCTGKTIFMAFTQTDDAVAQADAPSPSGSDEPDAQAQIDQQQQQIDRLKDEQCADLYRQYQNRNPYDPEEGEQAIQQYGQMGCDQR
jgi:hypothetical protein